MCVVLCVVYVVWVNAVYVGSMWVESVYVCGVHCVVCMCAEYDVHVCGVYGWGKCVVFV